MPRYIDVDLLMNDIEDLKKSPWYNDDFGNSAIKCARHEGLEIVVDLCIKKAPTADVQEVRHGKWNKNGNGRDCSICGFKYYANGGLFNFCPKCGAKMDRKEDEE